MGPMVSKAVGANRNLSWRSEYLRISFTRPEVMALCWMSEWATVLETVTLNTRHLPQAHREIETPPGLFSVLSATAPCSDMEGTSALQSALRMMTLSSTWLVALPLLLEHWMGDDHQNSRQPRTLDNGEFRKAPFSVAMRKKDGSVIERTASGLGMAWFKRALI